MENENENYEMVKSANSVTNVIVESPSKEGAFIIAEMCAPLVALFNCRTVSKATLPSIVV